ncbi:MAG: hypothetical protein AUJ55_10175 [Proteobacteria bacterium CG1_02_64_396]|nr:MAG: hypothetical protein AUJ55_10175 [Proteobacteria bacterium CG1_02_64_396]
MANVRSNQRALLHGRQTSPGVAEALTPATHGIPKFYNLQRFKPDLKPMANDNQARDGWGHNDPQFDTGAQVIPIKFDIPLWAPAANGAPLPVVGEILSGACQMTETINAGDVVYELLEPTDYFAAPSSTFYGYERGKKYVAATARGTATLKGGVNQPILLSVDARAPFVMPTAGEVIPAGIPTATGTLLLFTSGLAVTADGSTISITQFELDFGLKFEDDPRSGGVTVVVTNAMPTLKIGRDAVASEKEWDSILAATSVHFVFTWNGAVLDIPTAIKKDSTPVDHKGTELSDEVWEIHHAVGVSPFSLTVTAPAP